MPTSRQAAAGNKRQKTSGLTTLDSAECVTHDALRDEQYPLDRVEEHLLRLLAYEPTEGIGEVLALALRASGCIVQYSITGVDVSVDDAVSEADRIEEACLSSPAGCPSTYDIQRNPYTKRTRSLLVSTFEKLREADNVHVVDAVSRYVIALSTTRLQSLRFTVTVFAGCLAQATAAGDAVRSSLLQALTARAADVAPTVRKTAISELALVGETDSAVRAFNDPVGSVRLSALRVLSSLPGEVSLADNALRRVHELAQQDSELSVRRSALKFLIAKGLHCDVNLTNMLLDADMQSRNLAAAFIVGRVAHGSELAPTLLVRLVTDLAEALSSAVADRASSAIVFALDREKRFKVNWLEELGGLLTRDFLKESRSSLVPAATKKNYRSLAQTLDSESMQSHLLALYSAMASATGATSGTALLQTLPGLIVKLRYDDELLARAVTVAAYLPAEKLLQRPDSEQQMRRLFNQILELLAERSTPTIAKAAGVALAALPDSHRLLLLRDTYQDLRLRLATYLGPRGEVSDPYQASTDSIIMQMIVLARFVDISDLTKLPIWPMLLAGNTPMRQLVRALGMKGNAEVAEQCVAKLMALPSGPAVDEILQIYVSAKMRRINMNRLSLDINEQPPSNETVWRAAVAAGVI